MKLISWSNENTCKLDHLRGATVSNYLISLQAFSVSSLLISFPIRKTTFSHSCKRFHGNLQVSRAMLWHFLIKLHNIKFGYALTDLTMYIQSEYLLSFTKVVPRLQYSCMKSQPFTLRINFYQISLMLENISSYDEFL